MHGVWASKGDNTEWSLPTGNGARTWTYTLGTRMLSVGDHMYYSAMLNALGEVGCTRARLGRSARNRRSAKTGEPRPRRRDFGARQPVRSGNDVYDS